VHINIIITCRTIKVTIIKKVIGQHCWVTVHTRLVLLSFHTVQVHRSSLSADRHRQPIIGLHVSQIILNKFQMIVICRYVTRVSSYMKCKMGLVTQFHVLFLYKVEPFVVLHYSSFFSSVYHNLQSWIQELFIVMWKGRTMNKTYIKLNHIQVWYHILF